MLKIEVSQIIDHYKILRELDHGGMATVFLANDLNLSRRVVLKFHKSITETGDQNIVTRFKNEARVLASIKDSRVIDIYSSGFFKNHSYIVMEYFEGESISNILAKNAFEPKQALHILKELLKGLEVIHKRGILHRDIKASNILLDSQDNLKIIDFGISKELLGEDLQITRPDQMIGTLHYMAPEVLKGQASTPRSDIFSVGILFYEMITGEPPFVGENRFSIAEKIRNEVVEIPGFYRKKIPIDLINIFNKMVCLKPEKRFQNVTSILSELGKIDGFKTNEMSTPDFNALLEGRVQPLQAKEPSVAVKSLLKIEAIGPITIPSVDDLKDKKNRPNLLFLLTSFLFLYFSSDILPNSSLKAARSVTSKTINSILGQGPNRSLSSVTEVHSLLKAGTEIEYEVQEKSSKEKRSYKKNQHILRVNRETPTGYEAKLSINGRGFRRVFLSSSNPFMPIIQFNRKNEKDIQLEKLSKLPSLEVGKQIETTYFKLDGEGSIYKEYRLVCSVDEKKTTLFFGDHIPVLKVSCLTTSQNFKKEAVHLYSPQYEHMISSDIVTEKNGEFHMELRKIVRISR